MYVNHVPIMTSHCHFSIHVDQFLSNRRLINFFTQSRTEMPPEDILALQSALIKLALNVYPSETGYVDQVLQNSFNIFEEDKCVVESSSFILILCP